MKAVITLEGGHKFVADLIFKKGDARKERESQTQFEQRIIRAINASQPYGVNKVVNIHITRN